MVAEKQNAPQPRDATVRRERVLPWYHSPCARKSATRCPMQGSCLNAARTGMLTLLVGSIWDAGSEGITDLPTRCAVAPPPRSLQAFDKRRLHHNYSSYYTICFVVCQEYARIFLLLRKKAAPRVRDSRRVSLANIQRVLCSAVVMIFRLPALKIAGIAPVLCLYSRDKRE